MTNLTELETRTMNAISEMSPQELNEFSDCVVEDLVEITRETTKTLRGVLLSLVKKGLIYIDDEGEDSIYMTAAGYMIVGRN